MYYWFEEKKNGKDENKWLASLEELLADQNPFVLDFCYRTMFAPFGGFIQRNTQHVNVVLKAKAKEGKLVDMGFVFDSLKRCNLKHKVDLESYRQVVRCVINLKEYQLAQLIHELMEKKKYKISDKISFDEELKNELRDAASKADFPGYTNWVYKDGALPNLEIEKESILKKNYDDLVSTFEPALQPSFDKIPVIPDRDI